MSNGKRPAHPATMEQWSDDDLYGLTKREHFAGLAMQGILANPDPQTCGASPEDQSRWAVKNADAPITALAHPHD